MFVIILIVGKLDHTVGSLQHKGTALALEVSIPINAVCILETTQCFQSKLENMFSF